MKRLALAFALFFIPSLASAITVVSVTKEGVLFNTYAPTPTIQISSTGGTLAAGSYFYSITEVTVDGETKLGGEVAATTTGSTSTLTLSWDSDIYGTSYRIYRTQITGDYALNKFLTSTSGNTFADTGAIALSAGTPPPVSTTKTNLLGVKDETKGTANQITVTKIGDTTTLSTPQDLAPTSVVNFAKVRTGDIDLTCKDFTCEWTLFEHAEGLFLYNKRTKVSFQIMMTPASSDIVPIE